MGGGPSPTLPYPPCSCLSSLPCLAELPLDPRSSPPKYAGRQEVEQNFIEQPVDSQLGSQGPVICTEIHRWQQLSPQQWVGGVPNEEEWDSHIIRLLVQNTWHKAPTLHQAWQSRVLKDPGIVSAASPASYDVSQGILVVHHSMKDN